MQRCRDIGKQDACKDLYKNGTTETIYALSFLPTAIPMPRFCDTFHGVSQKTFARAISYNGVLCTRKVLLNKQKGNVFF